MRRRIIRTSPRHRPYAPVMGHDFATNGLMPYHLIAEELERRHGWKMTGERVRQLLNRAIGKLAKEWANG